MVITINGLQILVNGQIIIVITGEIAMVGEIIAKKIIIKVIMVGATNQTIIMVGVTN